MPDTTRAPERCHDEAPGPLGTGLYCGRLAGHDGQHGHGVYKWAPTAPVTAEGSWEHLHERFKQAILDQAATWEETFDAGPGEVVSVSDAASVIARLLAGDPGDLPARMAEAMREAIDYELTTGGESGLRELLASLDGPTSSALVAAALSVRWEHAAHLAARVGDAERRAEHAEGEHQVTQERLAEVCAHRGTLMKALEDENNLRVRTAVERDKLKDELDDMEGVITDLGVVRLQFQDTIERVKAVRDGWYLRPHMSDQADELDAALDGGE